MKKSILAVILIFCAFFYAFGQNSDTIDLVLLLDTSSSMAASYEKVNDYITGQFLSEFLRVGDTFHLISFSTNPRLDIARKISSAGDLETIVGRMLIQYPVEAGNDAKAALNYTEAYISTLPPRPKKIVIVSSGGTDTSGIISAAAQRFRSKNATIDFVSVTAGQSLANLPSSGRPPAKSQQGSPSGVATTGAQAKPSAAATTQGTTGAQTAAQGTGAQSSTQGTTAQQGTPAQGASQTGAQSAAQGTGAQSSTQGVSQTGAQSAAQGTGAQSSTQGTTTQGASQTSTQSAAQDTTQTAPSSSSGASVAGSSPQGVSSSDDGRASDRERDSPNQDPAAKGSSGDGSKDGIKQKKSGASINPAVPLIIGIIAAILLLVLLIIFISRRLGSGPNRVMSSVSSSGQEKEEKFTDHSGDLASYAARQSKKRETPYSGRPVNEQGAKQPVINPTSPVLLNLFVEDQSTSIGKRNIHSLKSGYSLSVGGGKSDDFMIFLVQMPPNLGEIRRNGSQLTFIPRKPKHFPDIGSNEVKDCINKRIRVVSDKNYEMWFSFVMYEDPLEALNRVLRSIKVPG